MLPPSLFRYVSSVESCSQLPAKCSSYCQPFSFLSVSSKALRTFVPLSVFCPTLHNAVLVLVALLAQPLCLPAKTPLPLLHQQFRVTSER